MLIKSLAGLALLGAVVATPFALATFNSAGQEQSETTAQRISLSCLVAKV